MQKSQNDSLSLTLILRTLLLLFPTLSHGKINTDFDQVEKSLQAKLKGINANSAQAKAKVMRTELKISFKHQLYESVEAKIEANAKLETGTNSSTVIDQYSPQNRVRAGDSYLKWDPLGFFFIKVGSLDQTRYTPLLIHRSPYTAAQEELYYRYNKNYYFYLNLQQAIPNNDVLTERLAGLEEGTPTYLTQTLGMKLDGDILSIRAFAKHFQFLDLSATVANQSRFIGNSISGSGDLNSSFLYAFDGYYLFTDILFKAKPWEFGFWFHYLYNDEAPDNRNTGYFWGPIFRYHPFGIGINLFENQSDSSPAFYANQAYPKNTEGKDYYIEIGQDKNDLQFRFHYIKTELLNSSLYQAPETYWTFEFKKKYTF
jgi:hypothetical protein